MTQPPACWPQHVSPEKTDSAQVYLLWRRDSQQHEVAEEEGHELLPQPRAGAKVCLAGQTVCQLHPWGPQGRQSLPLGSSDQARPGGAWGGWARGKQSPEASLRADGRQGKGAGGDGAKIGRAHV